MRRIEVPLIGSELTFIPIDNNPWPQYTHTVKAGFTIAHNGELISLKYFVEEGHLRAASAANGDIHKDSCVEFFIAFDDANYYNLEFNCIGWCKAGYGSSRENRIPLPITSTDLINTSTGIRSFVVDGNRNFAWELDITIPAAVFCYHQIHSLSKMKVKGNFYKCGDEMPEPHYLTWNHIQAVTPDFHRRDGFADIVFL